MAATDINPPVAVLYAKSSIPSFHILPTIVFALELRISFAPGAKPNDNILVIPPTRTAPIYSYPSAFQSLETPVPTTPPIAPKIPAIPMLIPIPAPPVAAATATPISTPATIWSTGRISALGIPIFFGFELKVTLK